MRLSGFLPVVVRRTVVALGVAGLLLSTASAAFAQQAAAPAQPEPADPFKFDGTTSVMLMIQVNNGQEAAFEEAYGAIRTAFAASDKPELQAQAKTMVLLRVTSDIPAPNPRPYFIYLDPPTANQSYDITRMLYYSGAWKVDDVEVRKQVDAIFEKLKGAINTQAVLPVAKK